MIDNDYVLVFPSWLPSRANSFNGDFNERMINAYSKETPSLVIYVVGESNSTQRKLEVFNKPNVKTVIFYYKKSSIRLLAKGINFFNYLWYSFNVTNICIKKYGKPKYIHCFVFFPAGLISWFYSKKYNLKHILTEHWTIFYETMPNNVKHTNAVTRMFITRLLSSFNLIMPVAEALRKQMLHFAPNANYKVIPNLVDERQFNFVPKVDNSFNFIHVSTLGLQKNPELLLNSFEKFLQLNNNANLKLIGPTNKNILAIVKASSLLTKCVEVLGELDHKMVAEQMKISDCFVLCSRFENLPCVILEALCCGLPIISTDVGGVSEVVNSTNGILMEDGDEEGLVNAFCYIFENHQQFNRKEISYNAIQKFNYKRNEEMLIESLKQVGIL